MRRRWTLRRLRPRLVVTLALVAALTAVTVAGASYAVVRRFRLERETSAAIEQSRFNLAFAAESLPPDATTGELEALVRSLQRRAGFDTVILAGAGEFQSSVSLGPAAIPDDLAAAAASGRVVAARRTVAATSRVVVGGRLQPDGPELWFFYPLATVDDDLRTLGLTLAGSAVVMVVLSAAVGVVAARGLLRPIASARDAARRVEGGDLGVRLDDEGSDEFAELSHSFNAMTAALGRTVTELRDAEAQQRRFVSDVSHELRTPVTALAAAADVLAPRVEGLQGLDRRAARILVDEAARLRKLIDELMEISRLDAGVAVLEPGTVDLAGLLDRVGAHPAWCGTVTVGGERPTVAGDIRRLERVFANLVDNAVRHGAPPVEVRIRCDAGRAVVDVDDHGPGIPAEHLPHLFQRFYKGDPARRRSSSSGLGLAIAAENVTLHGGTLTADNLPQGGARFQVSLPLAVADPLPDGDLLVNPGSEAGGSPTASTEGHDR